LTVKRLVGALFFKRENGRALFDTVENGKQPMGLSGNLPLEISEIEKSPK
jgi:hypothetical protein